MLFFIPQDDSVTMESYTFIGKCLVHSGELNLRDQLWQNSWSTAVSLLEISESVTWTGDLCFTAAEFLKVPTDIREAFLKSFKNIQCL